MLAEALVASGLEVEARAGSFPRAQVDEGGVSNSRFRIARDAPRDPISEALPQVGEPVVSWIHIWAN